MNMTIAISARNLYDKCKNAYLKKQFPKMKYHRSPSLSFNSGQKIRQSCCPKLYGTLPSKVHASTKDDQKIP